MTIFVLANALMHKYQVVHTAESLAFLSAQYSQSNRYYHNALHLEQSYNELLAVADLIEDFDVIVFALLYHDVVYQIHKSDNEEQSTKLALAHLSGSLLSAQQLERIGKHIMATKHHRPTADRDTHFFSDADLAILGQDHYIYDEYRQHIRQEYSLFPDILYAPGRKKVIKHLLDMPAIYHTAHFANRYETQARNNLKWEMTQL